MNEIECARCDWSGVWDDVDRDECGSVCPKCGCVDSMVETDGVNDDDYREDNPREVPNE